MENNIDYKELSRVCDGRSAIVLAGGALIKLQQDKDILELLNTTALENIIAIKFSTWEKFMKRPGKHIIGTKFDEVKANDNI